MKRTEAREHLMQLIFQMDVQRDYTRHSTDAFILEYMDASDQLGYFEAVLEAYILNRVEIDQIIENNSEGWHLKQLDKVILAVLRLAVTEIKFMSENPDFAVPASVSINEAVNIAKKFGDDESGRFVNAILGKIVRL